MACSKAKNQCLAILLALLCLAAGCARPRLDLHETTTLNSLRQVDDWPLYVMHYRGAYAPTGEGRAADAGQVPAVDPPETGSPTWACSLFAALGDPANRLYGRNFDWQHSPAVLLFADPPETDASPGYASVSMVDIAYLGYEGEDAQGLDELPLEERRPLLRAPYLPFDGMNERGLVIGMAAVSPGDMPDDPEKETLDSLRVMREVLDRAANVDEALAILDRYNIDYGGGPPLHYLIADRSGRALLVEFYRGERIVHRNEQSWHLATNFIVSSTQEPQSRCWRYDTLDERLAASEGQFSPDQAMDALSAVAQPNTQWSITYDLSTGQVRVAMGGDYERVHTFKLKVGD